MSHGPTRLARLRREVRVTALLALPLVLGQLSSMAMNFVDTVLAGRYGPVTLAAIGVGSALWTVVILVCVGVLMAIPPTVSQLNGAQRRHEIAAVFRQAVWLASSLGVLLFVLMRFSASWLAPLGITEQARPEAEAFLRAITWGAPALPMYFCFRYFSEGIAWTKPTMVFGVGGLLLLLPLGYTLMFRFRMGAAGLGYAYALILWLQALCFLAYLRFSKRYADLELFARFDPPHWSAIRELLRIGVPMGVSIFMEGSLFVATALIIGTLGTVPVAAHQIAIIMASAFFMIPLGIAMATTVRIGHAVGAEDPSGVRWAAVAGYAITAVMQTVSAAVLVFGGRVLADWITSDVAVASLATTLMFYAAAFQYPDGLQALSNGALRGLKDTRIPMYVTVLAYWALGMPLGVWFGLHRGLGAPGLWLGLILGLSVAAVLLTWRFWRLARRIVPVT